MNNKHFKDSEVEHLLNFLGYGNLSAPVWFLGMEEAGGGEENLRNRLSFKKAEDLYSGHKKLGITKHHEGNRLIQPTWRGMCVIMLTLMGRKVTRDEIRNYQAEHLGRHGDDTFLLELMPIPKASISSWSYEGLLPQFESREDYYSQILPRRIQSIQELISKYSPRAIIGYGKSFWGFYRELFKGTTFRNAYPYQIGEGNPLVILTHHFTSKTMNGRFTEIAEMIEL